MKRMDREKFKKAIRKGFCTTELSMVHTRKYDGKNVFYKDDAGLFHLSCIKNPISLEEFWEDNEVYVDFCDDSVLYVYRFEEATQEYITVLTYFWDEYHNAYEFLVDFTADVVRYFEELKK